MSATAYAPQAATQPAPDPSTSPAIPTTPSTPDIPAPANPVPQPDQAPDPAPFEPIDDPMPAPSDIPPPETFNAEQEDEDAQAQTLGDEALGRGSYEESLGDSEKVSTGADSDDAQDLVDHMKAMAASGHIDMDAYRGERNDDDEEDSLGPDAARP